MDVALLVVATGALILAAFLGGRCSRRPLVATINFQSPPDGPRQAVAALADRCFAASYFRYLGLT